MDSNNDDVTKSLTEALDRMHSGPPEDIAIEFANDFSAICLRFAPGNDSVILEFDQARKFLESLIVAVDAINPVLGMANLHADRIEKGLLPFEPCRFPENCRRRRFHIDGPEADRCRRCMSA